MLTHARVRITRLLLALALLVTATVLIIHVVPSIWSPPEREAVAAPAPARTATVDPAQIERLKRIMPPLLNAMTVRKPPSQIKLGIMDDPSINAANGGNGEFYV